MGREDTAVVLPIEAILTAEVVLDSIGETDTKFERVDFASPELGRRERCGRELAAGRVVGGRNGDVNPDEAGKVANLVEES